MARLRYSTLFLLALSMAPAAVPVPPADLQLVTVTSGLIRPVTARHAGDGSDRLFVVEKDGRILIWDGSQVLSTSFLDITALVDSNGNEQGLLGLAFHPDYPANGFFYVNYTRNGSPDQTVVERYSVSAGDPDVADAGSGVEIIVIDQDFSNHNGGDIHFGPDGYLYIGMGDGGGSGDPNDRGQDLMELLGKMLRLDVDGGAPYAIPADNPFVGNGDALDEIWAYGLRNPWRWSFDRWTDDLFIADVGQNLWEEIDFQPASTGGGENYGWNCYEGNHVFDTTSVFCNPPPGGEVFPILEYSHSLGCSVTGGYRYRGYVIGALQGEYVYADYCSGRIWFANDTAGDWAATEWGTTITSVTSFGEDETGELYVVTDGGSLLRFESPSAVFADPFESGGLGGWSSVVGN